MHERFPRTLCILKHPRCDTTKAVRGPITKFNQSNRSFAGPIFSKYWTE